MLETNRIAVAGSACISAANVMAIRSFAAHKKLSFRSQRRADFPHPAFRDARRVVKNPSAIPTVKSPVGFFAHDGLSAEPGAAVLLTAYQIKATANFRKTCDFPAVKTRCLNLPHT